MRQPLSSLLVLVLLLTGSPWWLLHAGPDDSEDERVKALRSGSRSPYVHRLTLYDHDGAAISPEDEPASPYSPAATCGKCHPYARIRHGWHFNGDLADVPGGRRGEPWILTDAASGTQLPISTRGWPGTYRPESVGLTRWGFVERFAHHIPGGGLGDPDQKQMDDAPEALRWGISGTLEVDCMFCHSADHRHDPAEAARQIDKQNFKWAPTAALGLAVIRGTAKRVPDDYDPFEGPNPNFPNRRPPKVVYDAARFDGDDRVLFPITRRVPRERCYFCHTQREAGDTPRQPWELGQDVHLSAGMTCTDCHRNDIGHQIVRGYPGEASERKEPHVSALTCKGCHLGGAGEASTEVALGGRHGAPRPTHRGIPLLHFEKLTCTACHSGPWPTFQPRTVQTSLAHRLGMASKKRTDRDPPIIHEPIFMGNAGTRIAPHRMLWPSFWGVRRGESTQPLPLEQVSRVAAESQLPPPEDDAQITRWLEGLGEFLADEGQPVFVHRGEVLTLTADNTIQRSGPSSVATAYVWPLAHDVRPASQSLGVRGCTDCHAEDAPFFFADVPGTSLHVHMHELQEIDAELARAWSSSFSLRSGFSVFGWVCSGLLGAVLLVYGLIGVRGMARRLGGSSAATSDDADDNAGS